MSTPYHLQDQGAAHQGSEISLSPVVVELGCTQLFLYGVLLGSGEAEGKGWEPLRSGCRWSLLKQIIKGECRSRKLRSSTLPGNYFSGPYHLCFQQGKQPKRGKDSLKDTQGVRVELNWNRDLSITLQ